MTINRRDFLKASGMFATWMALAACTPQKPVATATGYSAGVAIAKPTSLTPVLADDPLTTLTLNRISFGPTPEMYSRVGQIGLSAFIDEQLRERFKSGRVRLRNDQIHSNLPDRPEVYRMATDFGIFSKLRNGPPAEMGKMADYQCDFVRQSHGMPMAYVAG